jgi:hypothetical protein
VLFCVFYVIVVPLPPGTNPFGVNNNNNNNNNNNDDTCITFFHTNVYFFQARSQNCGKRLLASSCLSFRRVRQSAWKNSAPTGQILIRFYI